MTRIIGVYKKTFHSGIGRTPQEARDLQRDEVVIRNGKEGEYARTMKKGFREKFEKGRLVRKGKGENLGTTGKRVRGRLKRTDEVFERSEGDSYLERGTEGRLVKKGHYDLKASQDPD